MNKRLLILAAAALIALGCAGAPDADTNPLGVSAKPTAVAKPGQFGDGVYEVPADMKPGKYKTTVPADVANCYWARLKNSSALNINDNGSLAPGAKGLMVVTASDKAVKLEGGCIWSVSK